MHRCGACRLRDGPGRRRAPGLDQVHAGELRQERTLGDGRLEVIANLKNRGSAPVRVHVQCLFQNDQGAPFSVEGSWQSLSIAGDSTEVMRFTAPDAMVKAYEIRVRKV